jgi:hypothetical protein
MSALQPGIYRHYKGKLYHVIEVARHSETEEELVVYRTLYGDFGLWVRPLAMFIEQVEVDGQSIPRFAFVHAAGDVAGAEK